jgi:hypothetical protein
MTTHLHLEPWPRMSKAVPLLDVHRGRFTFYLLPYLFQGEDPSGEANWFSFTQRILRILW